MDLSNKERRINISTTGNIYSTDYSINLSDNKSLVCKYNYSNENKLIDKESIKYIDNIILSNIYTNINDLLDYSNKLPFNIIYNLFNSDKNILPANIFKNCYTLEIVSQIPDNYEKIGESAFNGCYNLKNINIHTNIIELEDSVFDGCKMLQSINASNLLKIGKRALAGTGIESISLNENIEYLSPFVFSDCNNLKTFSFDNPLTVYEGAFAGCTSLTSVEIEQYTGANSDETDNIETEYNGETNPEGNDDPDTPVNSGGNENSKVSGVNILPNYIFAGCKSLDVANNVSFINNINVIGIGSLMNCSSLKEFDNDIMIINDYGFKDCINLKNINLTNCEIISNYAFKNCQSLKTVDISNIKSMNYISVFENCTNIKNITQPDNIEIIGDNYFKNCKKLLSFDFSNITEIGNQSFFGCDSLGLPFSVDDNDNIEDIVDYGKNIYINTVVPENDENDDEIDSTYISNDDGTINLINNNQNDDENDNTNINTQVLLDLSNVTKIKDYSFYGCTSITDINLNSNVNLGEGVFMNCTSLKSIELPASVNNFTVNMFNNCTSLRRIKFNSGISEDIELTALNNCNKIQSIELPESDKYKVINNQCIIEKESNTIIYVVKDLSILNITEEYGNDINISDDAFNNCNLSIINISENINSPKISEKTFANISNNKFHILISRNDINYKRYINILGNNKIYYI